MAKRRRPRRRPEEGRAKKVTQGRAGTGCRGSAPHLAREHLPIPDPKHVGLTTYDAKDPNTKYPPITELRPPEGRTQRVDRADRRCGVRCVVGVRRAMQYPGGRALGGEWV